MDWNQVFDQLKDKGVADSDAELARWLGLEQGQIAKARAGIKEIPARSKFLCLDRLGYFKASGAAISALEAAFALLPVTEREKLDEYIDKFKAAERERTRKIALKEAEKRNKEKL